jgi:hypothetical protein
MLAGRLLMKGIEIKNLEVLNLHPKLIPIVEQVMAVYDLTLITSAYRPGDEGVHGQMPVRGLDLRCHQVVLGKAIEEDINKEWMYDPERPLIKVCVAHGEGDNFHVHLQVHRNTIKKG